jgi:hypothetical protein
MISTMIMMYDHKFIFNDLSRYVNASLLCMRSTIRYGVNTPSIQNFFDVAVLCGVHKPVRC